MSSTPTKLEVAAAEKGFAATRKRKLDGKYDVSDEEENSEEGERSSKRAKGEKVKHSETEENAETREIKREEVQCHELVMTCATACSKPSSDLSGWLPMDCILYFNE